MTASPIAALLIGNIILSAGMSLQTLLLPVRAGLEGFSTLMIGGLGSAHNVGYVVGCLLVAQVVGRLGHVRSYAALSLVAAAAALGYAATGAPEAWLGLRLVTGFCLAGLAMVLESWINANATNGNRGGILARFAITAAVAGTLGQMLLPVAGAAGPLPFWVIAASLVLAIPAIALGKGAPPRRATSRLSLRRLFAISPVGVMGCFCIGLANGAFWQLAPIYAQGRGLSGTGVAVFMSLVVLSGALAQWPVGRVSDRTDRRRVILGCLAAALVADALMAVPWAGAAATMAAVAVFGACVLPIYSQCVAHTNDFLGREQCVGAAGGLLLAFGVGAVIGPATASLLMQQAGPGGLFLHAGVIHVGFAGFVIWRMTRREAPDHVERPLPVTVLRAIVFPPRTAGISLTRDSSPQDAPADRRAAAR